ncbi:DUF4124 domain-containing protein [Paraglaciecola aestuariivivens]
MKSLVILGALLWTINVSAKVVYKTVKPDGTVVYSDVQTPGATAVKLSAVNTAQMPSLTANTQLTPKAQKPKLNQVANIKASVTILAPQPEQTLRDNNGRVEVLSQVSPKVKGQYQLLLNNRVLMTQASGNFMLSSIDRGAHTLQVNFLDTSGKILASSSPQIFYLHKASALFRAN